MALVLGILAIAILGIVFAHHQGKQDELHKREHLAGPDDQDLDFAAALRAGPLPSYSDEREARLR